MTKIFEADGSSFFFQPERLEVGSKWLGTDRGGAPRAPADNPARGESKGGGRNLASTP